MDKASALKLKPGQVVVYGDHKYTARCTRVLEGEVLFVTRNGGIRIRDRHGAAHWVPYHFVVRSGEVE